MRIILSTQGKNRRLVLLKHSDPAENGIEQDKEGWAGTKSCTALWALVRNLVVRQWRILSKKLM